MKLFEFDEHIGDWRVLVQTRDVQKGAVTTRCLADDAVTNAKIADGAITNEKIVDNTIEGRKFADNSIDNDKVIDGTLSGGKFIDDSIDGSKIKDNTVPGSKLADGSIESVDIKDNTLEGSKLVDNSIDGSKIKGNQIEGRHLIDNSIPGSKIKDGTIENVDIKDNTLDGAKIIDNTVDGAKIANGAINADKLVNNSVTAAKIEDYNPESAEPTGVTTAKIADGAVGTSKIEDYNPESAEPTGVTTAKIADKAVTEDKLAPQAVTTDKLAPGLISEIENITDAIPTPGSVKPVQSGGVYDNLIEKNEITGYKLYNYSLKADNTFGTGAEYKHGVIPVVAGDCYVIENVSESVDTVRYAFAYSSAFSPGADVPLVPDTSVVVVYHSTKAYINIPEGCTFLLLNGYEYLKLYKILNLLEAEDTVSSCDNKVSGRGVAEYVGLPSKYYEVSWDTIKLTTIDSIVLKKGHTYIATAERTSTNTCYLYICSGNSSDEGTKYITLSMGSNVTTSTGTYTNNTDADIMANIVVRGTNAIEGLHLVVTEQSNKVVWTTAQTLSSDEKAQALANLGIDLSGIINTNAVRSKLTCVFLQSLNFDNTNHKVVIGSMNYANTSSPSGRIDVAAAEVDYTFNQSTTTIYWFVYDTSDSSYKFIRVGNSTLAQIIIASIYISGNGTTNGKVLDVTWCVCENYKISGVNVDTRVTALENPDVVARNIIRDAAVRATGTKAVTEDIKPLSLIHVSDIHTKSNNYKCFQNACEFYEHYSNIAAMIVTGDLVYDSYADLMTYYDTSLTKTTKPVLNVIGNHDAGQQDNSNPSLGRVCTDLQCYERYIAPYVEGWGVTQPTDAATNGLSYYYKDFTTQKVRLIVLNEFETEYELSGTDPDHKLKYSREYRAMRQAQVTWLITTLTNTPSDYGVVVALHQPLGSLASADNPFVSFDMVGGYKFNVYSEDKEWLAKIINAYANKTSLTLSVTQTGAVVQNDATLNCNCDFTSVQSEFICVLCGHVHRDYIGHLANYPAIPILAVGADNLNYTSSFQPREAGTPSEDLFNVINIDRNRKTIKIIRIGSDASVTGQVRDQMLISYAQS